MMNEAKMNELAGKLNDVIDGLSIDELIFAQGFIDGAIKFRKYEAGEITFEELDA